MRVPLTAVAAILLALVMASCRGRGGVEADAPIQVKDDLGRTVSLREPAGRIASLSPSNTEILFALGCGERMVLRDATSSFPPAALTRPATSAFHLSAEHLAGFRPDLVLLSHLDATRLRGLEAANLRVASFDPRTLEALYGNLVAIGQLCGAEPEARLAAAGLRRRAAAVVEAVRGRPRPTVYIEIDGSNPQRPWVAGRGSFADHLVGLAGARNFIDRLSRPVAPVSAEEVIAHAPEVILLANVEGDSRSARERLAGRPGWAQLPALRSGRIIDSIHRDLLSRPGPRALDGLEALAAALHPEAFRR